MGSYPIDKKRLLDVKVLKIDDNDNNLQKPNIFNQYVPFAESIRQQGFNWFDEIRENLSRIIQLNELQPGFSFWSNKLDQFLLQYGFCFTKQNHLKLIHFYLSILSITDLSCLHVKVCLDMLHKLLRKTKLLTRDDLLIDWHIFYKWTKVIYNNHDKDHGLLSLPKDIDFSIVCCTHSCSPYFSTTATREILDQFLPQLCPTDWSFHQTIHMLSIFLPVCLPVPMHDQGFKLWLDEFFGIWQSLYNQTAWELYLISMFSSVAWNHMGYINWEPWLSQIFTRLLRGFALPVGEKQILSNSCSYIMSCSAKWIVAMLNDQNSCFQYLQDLFISIKNFYHPSNVGNFQKDLMEFLLKLAEYFVDRVHLERKVPLPWCFVSSESSRLTEQNITDFVNLLKEYAFISIFNKSYSKQAADTCQYLSMLRPELIVPPIIDQFFSSLNHMTEPHRFTSIVNCLIRIAPQIVRQTDSYSYSHGQTYVIPLLMAVLPGIDLNDSEKMTMTLDFLNTILKLVPCVDCSSAVFTRNDLTETEKEVCLSTGKFEEFIIQFLDRIFRMIEILSTDTSEGSDINDQTNSDETIIQTKLISIMINIVKQCSNKIFRTIQTKIMVFTERTFLSPKVRKLVAGIVGVIVRSNPDELLEYLLPKTCDSIERIINYSDAIVLSTDPKGDIELTWYLILFMELVCTYGNALLNYKQMIMTVFHRCVSIINKDAYEAIAESAAYLLGSLVRVYALDDQRAVDNTNESFIDHLPIRAWGETVGSDQIQIQFHIPNADEIDFACDFVNTFIYPELQLLSEKGLKISNTERLRSLTLIHYLTIGCFRMIPFIDSEMVPNIMPCNAKYPIRYAISTNQSKFKENLRMRLVNDIGKLLDQLVENQSDDVKSIKVALKICSSSSIDYGESKDHALKLSKDVQFNKKLFANKLCGQRQYPRFLATDRVILQIRKLEVNHFKMFTEIDKQIVHKLFDLSINRYSEIRRKAQFELFTILQRYDFSSQVILDRIVQLLNSADEIDHDQLKGCLYILLGNNSFCLPVQHLWQMREKLWPLIALINHAKRPSTQTLLNNINKKIRNYLVDLFIQKTNETVMKAAITLWRPLESNKIQKSIECVQSNVQSRNNLMETLSSSLKKDTLTWKQQENAMSLLSLLLQTRIPISPLCIQVFVDYLIHDNIEIRKYATKALAAICRLQKPPRIIVEKSSEDILPNIDKSSVSIVNNECRPGLRDDNLWLTIDGYKPPKTQLEWEQTCFLDKSFHGYYRWPKIIKYSMNIRTRYTLNTMPEEVTILYDRFIDKSYVARLIELTTYDETNGNINFDEVRFALFKGLFRNFGLLFIDNFMEQLYVLIREEIREKQKASHRVAAEIVAGMIRGSKYWTLEMLDELWTRLTPLLTEVCVHLSMETRYYWNQCFQYGMRNTDPRRMTRPIEFLRTLINNPTSTNSLNESSIWYAVDSLKVFQWRIPSIWRAVNEQAVGLLDHSSKSVRDLVISVLTTSFKFDVTLFNGTSGQQPNISQFIDWICERLSHAIEVCNKLSLVNVSNDDGTEMDLEACEALNFVETIIQIVSSVLAYSLQPINDELIRLFPYLCEIESIVVNNETLHNSLTYTRISVGMKYLHEPFLQTLIEQLEQICKNPKWHVRQAAISFIQNMIFCNLFNARQYAQRLNVLVRECLVDEQLEVRMVASTTLAGLYQCGYIQVTNDDLEYFRVLSENDYFTKIDGKKVISPKNIITRHGGVLGLCAIVLSSPYDISVHVSHALMLVCKHSYDVYPIQKSVQQCLSNFRRTHHDSWNEHQKKFTEDQLMILTEAFISQSYYT